MTKVEYRTCAHLLCLTVVLGPEGALCDDCNEDEKLGNASDVGPYRCCPKCDNDSEDAI